MRSTLTALLAVAALVGCGDATDADASTPTSTTASAGAELAGFAFDVRRDPG